MNEVAVAIFHRETDAHDGPLVQATAAARAALAQAATPAGRTTSLPSNPRPVAISSGA